MPEPYAIPPRYRGIAVLMLLVAVSLAVEATLHLSGTVRHNGGNETAAGYSEAVIGVVLLWGAIGLARRGGARFTVALGTTVFAIAGFILGLTETVPSGYAPDIAYHVAVLPVLIIIFVLLLRVGGSPAGVEPRTRLDRS